MAKRKSDLHVGKDARSRLFFLPLDLVTQTAAVLGIRGSGKTNTGVVFAEELMTRGQQVVIVDPLDVWWGLRSRASGKRAGFPIVVLGGEHGDVPLQSNAGKVVAEFCVHQDASVILSTRHLSKTQTRQFVTDFAETLYDLKGKGKFRSPLHVAIDEADMFAPQRLYRGAERTFGAIDQLVRRGRASGIGVTLITQRAATLNKDVLTQCEMLICHRTISPQDRKAIEAWVEVHDAENQAKKVLSTLHKLKLGSAWVWSPGWLGTLEQVQIRLRATFDSSATPKAGEKIIEPKKVAKVDLDKLSKAMAEAIEQSEQNDPTKLRQQVRQLKKELRLRPEIKATAIRVPTFTEADEEYLESLIQLKADWEAENKRHQAAVSKVLAEVNAVVGKGQSYAQTRALQAQASKSRPNPLGQGPPMKRSVPSRGPGSPEVGKSGLRRILVALAQCSDGLSVRQIGVRAGISSKSGTFNTYLSKARSNGWIIGERAFIKLTQVGYDALGEYERLPEGRELLAYWVAKLGKSGASRMLQELAIQWPKLVSKELLAELAGLSSTSGTFNTYLSRLRSLELIEGKAELKAVDALME